MNKALDWQKGRCQRMSVFEALGISVCAGVIVLILVWTSQIMWSWIVENVYLRITCRHLTDISGPWVAEFKDASGNDCYDQTELKQSGYKIEGVSRYRIVFKDGRELRKEFALRGLLRNDLLSAYYWNVNRREKGSGTMTLAVSKQGDVLKGKYAWFDVELDKIHAGDYEWKRGN